MAKKADIKEEPKFEHLAIKSANIGSNKDGSPKKKINNGQKLLLTQDQAKSYRLQKIIK